MKVLIVAPYFHPKTGGLEYYVFNIAKGLKQLGHDVVIVTSNHKFNHRLTVEENHGLKIYRLPYLFIFSHTPYNPFWRYSIAKIFQSEKPDVINAHTPVPYIADLAARVHKNIPVVLTYHNDLIKEGFSWQILIKLTNFLLQNKTLRIADAIIATSRSYAENSSRLKNHYGKLKFVAPGVDIARFNPSVDRNWLKKTYGNRFTVLFVGQMDRSHAHKGVPVLLRAASHLQRDGLDVQVILVGKGNAIGEYKLLASKLGVKHTQFVGYVEDSCIPKYFAGSDVTVLPSITASEGFGMILLEASACGRPVVGSAIGGIPEAIANNRSGLLVTAKSAESLASSINRLYKHPELAIRLGTYGSKRITQHFNWQKSSELTESVLLEVVKKAAVR